MKYRTTQKPLPDRPLFTNNDRKYHGLPLHRKIGRKKRYFSRKECVESLYAFLDYCDR